MDTTSKFRKGRSVECTLKANLVFVTKRRAGCINEQSWEVINRALHSAAAKLGVWIVEAGWQPDNVQLVVEYPAKLSVSAMVNSLKGVSSRALRSAGVDAQSRSRAFWSPSYFAASASASNLASASKYVSSQRQQVLP